MVWGNAASAGVDDLVRRLSANDPKLTSLHILKHRKFGVKEVTELCRALEANTVLTELTAVGHALPAESCAALAQMLTSNSALRSLSVGDSTLGDEAVVTLADKGLAHNTTLTLLDLESKGLSSTSAAALSRVLLSSSGLTSLLLARNPLGDAGVAALCGGSAGSGGGWRTLRHLDLQACGLTHQAVQSLASFGGLHRLETLRLGHNDLAQGGAATADASAAAGDGKRHDQAGASGTSCASECGTALALLVSAASGLRELHLQGTGIGDAGCEALAAALPQCGVTLLDVSDSSLGAPAGRSLSAALRGGAALSTLRMSGNGALTDSSLAELAGAVAQSTTLRNLDLGGTQVGPAAVAALARCSRLENLSLFGCRLTGEAANVLAAVLQPAGHPDVAGGTTPPPADAAGKTAAAPVEVASDVWKVPVNEVGGTSGAPLGATDGPPTPLTSGDSSGAAIGGGGFVGLCDLSVSACGLSLPELRAVVQALSAGGAPKLQSLEIGANPATQDDATHGLVEQLRVSRPGIRVHWLAGDDTARMADLPQAP